MADKLEYHPIANDYPLMKGEAFESFCENMRKNGFLKDRPITLHKDGRILDGRNRYEAALKVGVAPLFTTWDGLSHDGNAIQFVWSLNHDRLHQSREELILTKANVAISLEGEAKTRQVANLKHGEMAPSCSEEHNGTEAGRSHEIAAKIVGETPGALRRPINIAKHATEEERDAVLSGKVSMTAMDKQIRMRRQENGEATKATPPIKVESSDSTDNVIKPIPRKSVPKKPDTNADEKAIKHFERCLSGLQASCDSMSEYPIPNLSQKRRDEICAPGKIISKMISQLNKFKSNLLSGATQ